MERQAIRSRGQRRYLIDKNSPDTRIIVMCEYAITTLRIDRLLIVMKFLRAIIRFVGSIEIQARANIYKKSLILMVLCPVVIAQEAIKRG